MLRSVRDMERYRLSGVDGEVGSVIDFLFDDEHWTIRYLVAEMGGLLDGRRVLISPVFLLGADWETRRMNVALTVDRLRDSPALDAHMPVSRQHERDYHRYYDIPYYWGHSGVWGMGGYPNLLPPPSLTKTAGAQQGQTDDDVHLRSVREVSGYHLQGTDHRIGHVSDLVLDDEAWTIRYLVVDTRDWWPGRKVLVAPNWATSISWDSRTVRLALSQRAIRESPEWDPHAPVNRRYEARLYDYHGRPAYWG